MTVICLYSLFISRNWFYLYLFMTSIGTLSFLIVLLLVPESPKWLLINGRKQEAVEALNKIAKINGVDSKIYDDD
jgi:inner membrane protein involved in colicin E2 resistance